MVDLRDLYWDHCCSIYTVQQEFLLWWVYGSRRIALTKARKDNCTAGKSPRTPQRGRNTEWRASHLKADTMPTCCRLHTTSVELHIISETGNEWHMPIRAL
ncbi:unnamed protein product [Acanthoscelides obtectus]|uniref:Uncharacterized protein n=1 Tax=Acanthoscelides obtectus TaxID=200917 RepID=A0A9P0LCK5_ACAOB|nr:unnamed protein product [Acanthoscelides obtectus]CAK1669786.1 hypothetical protein AOBTE_LOCUS27248 [Acanthoscelides obtectus]